MSTSPLKTYSNSNENTYGGIFIGCLAVFLLTLAFLEWVFKITELPTLLSRILLCFIGFMAQYRIFGTHFFRTGDYLRAIEHQEKTALLYGQEFKFKSRLDRSKHNKFRTVSLVSAFSLLYMIVLYFISKTPLLMDKLELSAIVIGLTIAAINQPTRVWLPAFGSISALFFKGVPKDISIISSFLFYLSLAVSCMLFAMVLRSIYESNASNENNPSNQSDKLVNTLRSEVKLSKGHVIALLIGAFIFYVSRETPTKDLKQAKPNKINEMKNISEIFHPKGLKADVGSIPRLSETDGGDSESERNHASQHKEALNGKTSLEGVKAGPGGVKASQAGVKARLGDHQEGLGDGQEVLGDGDDGPGSGQEALGDGHESPDDGQELLGDGLEGLGDGHEGLGDGHEGLGDGLEGLGDGLEGLGDGHEGLGDGHEGLGDGHEGLGDGQESQAGEKGMQGGGKAIQGSGKAKRSTENSGALLEELGNRKPGQGNQSLPRRTPASQVAIEQERTPTNPPKFKKPKEDKKTKPLEIGKILLSIAVIGALLCLFLVFSRKSTKKLQQPSRSIPEKNPQKAKECLNLINEIVKDREIESTMTPQKIREKIISLYNLLIAANTHLGFQRSIDMTPDEYQAQLAKVAPHKQDGMIYVTKVYSHVYYGNQFPNFSQFQMYLNAVRHSVLEINTLF